MDLLLHICCGPCLIYPFKKLKEKGLNLKGFYYNPNIHPLEEFKRRRGALETLNKDFALEIETPQYNETEFYKAVGAQEEKPLRCLSCYMLRLRKTASAARKNGILNFSTTLLVSPYQDHEKLKEIGNRVAGEFNLNFYYEDFRPGFRDAYKEARKKKLYLQNYCGCKYSNEKK